MGHKERRVQARVDARWAEVERLDERHARRMSKLALLSTPAMLAGIVVINHTGWHHAAWPLLVLLLVLAGLQIPLSFIERRRRQEALRNALVASARSGDVTTVPRLIHLRGSPWSGDEAEVDRLLIELLGHVCPEHAEAVRARPNARISALLPVSATASRVSSDDEPLVLAALAALQHVGDRRDLPRIRPLATPEPHTGWGIPIRRAAEEAIAAIEERIAREAAGATLLRPAEPGGDALLRPAEGNEASLLRPAEDSGEQRNEVRA